MALKDWRAWAELLRPMDVAFLAYLTGLGAFLVFFHKGVPRWPWLVGLHILVMSLVLLFISWAEGEGVRGLYGSSKLSHMVAYRLIHFFRTTYPGWLYALLYKESGLLIHVIWPGTFDWVFIRMDQMLFLGFHPSVLLGQLGDRWFWLTEYMSFCYAMYYVLLLIVGLTLYIRRKYPELERMLLQVGLAFYICFALFILFPAEGPRFTLTHLGANRLHGGVFFSIAQAIVNTEGYPGCAFPSSHVAVAFVALMAVRRYEPVMYRIMLPLVVSLFISTVYGGYHYVVDVLAGIGAGWLGIYFGERIERWWVRRSLEEEIYAI